jgi:hypothetical protein
MLSFITIMFILMFGIALLSIGFAAVVSLFQETL